MKRIAISVFSLAAMLWLTLSPAMASSGCCGQQQSRCGHACCRNHHK